MSGSHPGSKHGHQHHHHVDFEDVTHWVERFESPERVGWQKPAEVIAALNVARGERVADIGAGTGYFSIPLGRAVGPKGIVYAIDSEPAMVRYLAERASREELPMIRASVGKPGDPAVPEPVDLIFIANALHHFDDWPKYLRRLERHLKPTGRVVILDWHKRKLPVGPPKEMKIAATEVVDEMRDAGFALIERQTFLPYQYFLAFRIAK